jgi:hypothetical protein
MINNKNMLKRNIRQLPEDLQRTSKNNLIIVETKDEQGNLHSYNNKPAVVFKDGTKLWYKHGLIHRLNGHARIDRNGAIYYYRDGNPINS